MSQLTITRKMSGKMAGFISINTSPLANPFCQSMAQKDTVCSKCYSQRLEKFYGSSGHAGNDEGQVDSWVKNGSLLSLRPLKENEIPQFRVPRVRFHAHGELHNVTHLNNFIAIAEANPEVMFALWTKRGDIARGNLKKLDNLIYVYSNPKLDAPLVRKPKGFHKIFSVFTRPFVEEQDIHINCAKHCAPCLMCYRHNDVERVNELLK